MSPLRIPPLVSGGLVVTYRCSSRCAHCLYACSPQRSNASIAPESARRCLRRIRELGCRSVHVGGGEPFLAFDALVDVLHAAREERVGIDYVETNASWFTGAHANDKLVTLREAGLDTLLISISPLHNEFIPLARVASLITACRRNGIGVFPWMPQFLPELEAFDADATHSLDEQEAHHGPGYVQALFHRYALVLGGRAAATFSRGRKRRAWDVIADGSPCRRLADVHHFHVDMDERYVPGLCAGLAIALDDLPGPLLESRYPLLARLWSGGVREAGAWAARLHGFKPRSDGYVDPCEACLDIRQHLFRCGVHVPELHPAGFYEQLELESGSA